jgi:type 2 lantibiotic biosynthesis protein LanM
MTLVSDRSTPYDDARAAVPDHVVEVCDSRGALFGRHHLDDVADLDAGLATVLCRLDASTDLTLDHDGVRRGAASALLDSLVFHGSRTLLADFHAALDAGSLGPGRADGAPEQHRFRLFDEHVSSPAGRAVLRRRHPGWAALADRLVRTRLRLLEECCTRFVADLDDVARVIGARPARLLDVSMSSGDSHAGGRSVVILRTDVGRVVYKPRSLAADLVVDDVLRRLRVTVGEDAARLPRTVDRGTHGWQEHVTPRACRSAADVVTYYRRLGSLLAVLRALGTTDIHFENLIASGPDPFVVDLETLLRRRADDRGSLDDAVGHRLGRSVLGTMMLPMNYAGATFDIDLSAMGVVEEQTSDRFASWTIVDAGTDAIRYERTSTPIRHEANLVRLGEDHVDHREHDDDVVAGFSESWTALCSDPTVLAPAERAARGVGRRVPVRQVLRPTAVYWRFLEASLHPTYLDDDAARRALLERLGTTTQVPEHAADDVLRHEVEALLRGDIPLFDNALDSRDLLADGEHVVPEVYDEPLGTELLANLAAVEPAAETAERSMIRTALMTAARHVWHGGVRRGDAGSARFRDDDPLAAARALGAELETLAVRTDGPRAAWIVARLHDERRLQIARNDFGLFEGGGILVALAALGRATGEERHLATARAALDVLLDDVEPWLGGSPASAYTGTTSLLAVAARVAGTTPRTRELARAVDLPGVLEDVLDGARELPDDLLLGLAGLVRLQLEVSAHHPALTRPVALEPAYERLLGATGDGSGGMAHGRTGVLMVLAELAGTLGGDRPAEVRRLLVDPVRLDDPDGDARATTSWCRGLAGATLAAARGLRSVGLTGPEAAAEVAPSVRALLGHDTVTGDLSLCHGSAGVVAALAELSVLLDDPALAGQARDEARRALASAYRDGWTGGLLRSAGLTTGFLGTAGLAHALVQAHDPTTPSLLCLDLDPAGGTS